MGVSTAQGGEWASHHVQACGYRLRPAAPVSLGVGLAAPSVGHRRATHEWPLKTLVAPSLMRDDGLNLGRSCTIQSSALSTCTSIRLAR